MNIRNLIKRLVLNFYDIKIYDDFFESYCLNFIEKNISNLPFYRSEYDLAGRLKKKSGLVHYIDYKSDVYNIIENRLVDKNILTDKNKIDRMYYNLFLPNENPQYHVDSKNNNDITVLVYLDNIEIDMNENGCTEFDIDSLVLGIPHIKNRVVVFNSTIKHRATSFLDKDRYSIAVKIVKDW